MKTKKYMLFVTCAIISILVLALLLVILLIFNKSYITTMINDAKDEKYSYVQKSTNYLPREQLNISIVPQINVVFNYDKYSPYNKKIELSITGDEAVYISKLLSEFDYPDKGNLYSYIEGDYQIILSNGTEFMFDYKHNSSEITEALYISNGKELLTSIPNDVKDIIVKMIDNILENRSNIYSTNKIIIKQNNEEISVSNQAYLQAILQECKLIYEVDKLEEQKIVYQVVFNEDTTLQMYEDRVSAKVISKGNERYVKMQNSGTLNYYFETIINNHKNNLQELLKTNTLAITQNGKTIEIIDKTIIDNMLKLFNQTNVKYDTSTEYQKAIMDYLTKNNNEYDIMISLENAQIFIFANSEGIIRGTSGNIIHSDKKISQVFMTEELIECIEDLIK